MRKDFKFERRWRFDFRNRFVILCSGSLLLFLWLGHPLPQLAASLSSVVNREVTDGRAWQIPSPSTDLLLENSSLDLDLPGLPTTVDTAATDPIPSPLQVGLMLYQSGDVLGAIAQWERAAAESSDPEMVLWQYLARAYQQIGQVDRAIAYWDLSIDLCRQIGETQGLSQMLVEQGQAYSSLGQHRQAIALLCGEDTSGGVCQGDSALGLARSIGDDRLEIAALGSLGNAYRVQGDYTASQEYLQESLERSHEIGDLAYEQAALNSLGNLYTNLAKRDYRYGTFAEAAGERNAALTFQDMARQADIQALRYFDRSRELSQSLDDPHAALPALLNRIESQYRIFLQERESPPSWEEARVLWERLSNSHDKAYGAIRLAHLIQFVSVHPPILFENRLTTQCFESSAPPETIALLEQAISIAQSLGDRSTESFALGRLGHVYECQGNFDRALELTQQAQLANPMNSESGYLWEWQGGRLYKATGDDRSAILSYQKAVETLEKVRGDMAVASRELQLNFRDAVEPVYRQLAELQIAQAQIPSRDSQAELSAAVHTIEQLRLAQLQNYLGSECELPVGDASLREIDPHTAVWVSIGLGDRFAAIVNMRDGQGRQKFRLHWLPLSRSESISAVNNFRFNLEKRSDRTKAYLEGAQQLYDGLIRPFSDDLAAAEIDTLVFLNDGIFRSIPMAALHDGEHFLIEQYAISTTPTLILDPSPALDPEDLRVLAFGLTEPSQINAQIAFPPLDNIASEIEAIQTLLPRSVGLLDEDFTIDRLRQKLETANYPVLHLATHAQFSIDSRKTFLVTGQLTTGKDGKSYNDVLTLNQLYQLIKNTQNVDRPLALLVLSACETAVGNDRDSLGLAGVALQAGVRRAIASLWQVDDRATTEIITQFYQYLHQGLKLAAALQATQKAWLATHSADAYQHPGYWAAFLAIGNG